MRRGGIWRPDSRGLRRNLGCAAQVSENKLKAAELGMVVHIQCEGDVEGVSRKKLLLLHGLSEAPSHGAKRDIAAPVRRGIFVGDHQRRPLWNGGCIRMTARR